MRLEGKIFSWDLTRGLQKSLPPVIFPNDFQHFSKLSESCHPIASKQDLMCVFVSLFLILPEIVRDIFMCLCRVSNRYAIQLKS